MSDALFKEAQALVDDLKKNPMNLVSMAFVGISTAIFAGVGLIYHHIVIPWNMANFMIFWSGDTDAISDYLIPQTYGGTDVSDAVDDFYNSDWFKKDCDEDFCRVDYVMRLHCRFSGAFFLWLGFGGIASLWLFPSVAVRAWSGVHVVYAVQHMGMGIVLASHLALPDMYFVPKLFRENPTAFVVPIIFIVFHFCLMVPGHLACTGLGLQKGMELMKAGARVPGLGFHPDKGARWLSNAATGISAGMFAGVGLVAHHLFVPWNVTWTFSSGHPFFPLFWNPGSSKVVDSLKDLWDSDICETDCDIDNVKIVKDTCDNINCDAGDSFCEAFAQVMCDLVKEVWGNIGDYARINFMMRLHTRISGAMYLALGFGGIYSLAVQADVSARAMSGLHVMYTVAHAGMGFVYLSSVAMFDFYYAPSIMRTGEAMGFTVFLGLLHMFLLWPLHVGAFLKGSNFAKAFATGDMNAAFAPEGTPAAGAGSGAAGAAAAEGAEWGKKVYGWKPDAGAGAPPQAQGAAASE